MGHSIAVLFDTGSSLATMSLQKCTSQAPWNLSMAVTVDKSPGIVMAETTEMGEEKPFNATKEPKASQCYIALPLELSQSWLP